MCRSASSPAGACDAGLEYAQVQAGADEHRRVSGQSRARKSSAELASEEEQEDEGTHATDKDDQRTRDERSCNQDDVR